ncbi:MAG: hypothetical protein H7233_13895 [Pseudorhodobacter sp.]|nr:hypothetical protein [Frankiaceae bacterium]
MIVQPDDADTADVLKLIEAHLIRMLSQSEPGDLHALDVGGRGALE